MKAIATATMIRVNGKNAELPKRTLAVVEKGDALKETESRYEHDEISLVECITAEYGYLEFLFGREKLDELFDGEALEEIDVTEISLAVVEAQRAYSRRVSDTKTKYALESLNKPEIKSLVDMASKVKALN